METAIKAAEDNLSAAKKALKRFRKTGKRRRLLDVVHHCAAAIIEINSAPKKSDPEPAG